jgi:hypothetical protein
MICTELQINSEDPDMYKTVSGALGAIDNTDRPDRVTPPNQSLNS